MREALFMNGEFSAYLITIQLTLSIILPQVKAMCGCAPVPICPPRPCVIPVPVCPQPAPCPPQFCPPPPICPPPPPPQIICPQPRPCGCSGGGGGGGGASFGYIMPQFYGYRMGMASQYQFPMAAPFYGSSYASASTVGSGGGCSGGASAPAAIPPATSRSDSYSSRADSYSSRADSYAAPTRVPSQNDCCGGCSSPCKYRSRRTAFTTRTSDPACNSEELKEIITQFVTDDVSDSKRQIQAAAEDMMGFDVNVVCAKGEFGYIAHTDTFCQASRDNVTCYVFKPL